MRSICGYSRAQEYEDQGTFCWKDKDKQILLLVLEILRTQEVVGKGGLGKANCLRLFLRVGWYIVTAEPQSCSAGVVDKHCGL